MLGVLFGRGQINATVESYRLAELLDVFAGGSAR